MTLKAAAEAEEGSAISPMPAGRCGIRDCLLREAAMQDATAAGA